MGEQAGIQQSEDPVGFLGLSLFIICYVHNLGLFTEPSAEKKGQKKPEGAHSMKEKKDV